MTDSPRDPAFPISFALGSLLDARIQAVADNPLGSQTRSLSQNIDAIYAVLAGTVEAVRALEAQVAASSPK